MSPRLIPVDPFDLVVFGATGDLAQRKLIPALFHRDEQGQIPPDAKIIGTSRRELSDEAFRAFALVAIEKFVEAEFRKPDFRSSPNPESDQRLRLEPAGLTAAPLWVGG